MRGFDALHRCYFSPDLQSNKYLSKITDKAKRLILASSRGSRFEVGLQRIMELFLLHFCISVGWCGC